MLKFFQPEFNWTIKATLNDGTTHYLKRIKIIVDYPTNHKVFFASKKHKTGFEKVILKEKEVYQNCYYEEGYLFIDLKKIKSWKYVNTKELIEEENTFANEFFKNFKTEYVKFNPKYDVAKDSYEDWINNHGQFIRNFITDFDYSDSEIENPNYVISMIYGIAYKAGRDSVINEQKKKNVNSF